MKKKAKPLFFPGYEVIWVFFSFRLLNFPLKIFLLKIKLKKWGN
jgi:hypothetical protein